MKRPAEAKLWPSGTARAYREAFVEALESLPKGAVDPLTVAWVSAALQHVHSPTSASRLYNVMMARGLFSATSLAPRIATPDQAAWAKILRGDGEPRGQVGGLDLGAIGEDEDEGELRGEGEGRGGGHPLEGPTGGPGILDTTPPTQACPTVGSPVPPDQESVSTKRAAPHLPFWHDRSKGPTNRKSSLPVGNPTLYREHPGLTVFHLRSWMAVWDMPVDQGAVYFHVSTATMVEILRAPDRQLLPLHVAGHLATYWGRHPDDFLTHRQVTPGEAVKVALYTTRDPRAKADMNNHGLPMKELLFERRWSPLQREWAAWAASSTARWIPQKYKGLDSERGVGCYVEHEPSGLWSVCDRWRTFDLNRFHAMKDLAIKMGAR